MTVAVRMAMAVAVTVALAVKLLDFPEGMEAHAVCGGKFDGG